MERRRDAAQEYDYRRHDRIWERVSPELTPFPRLRGEGEQTAQTMQTTQERQAALSLPGAEADPCCLGSAAEESLPVLTGFLREERQAARLLRALLRCAPSRSACAVLEELLHGSCAITRRMESVCYLIEGRWQPRQRWDAFSGSVRWQEGLRMAYHLEVCGALNYARAGEETIDPCLRRLLEGLSREKYARSDRLLNLLSETRRD